MSIGRGRDILGHHMNSRVLTSVATLLFPTALHTAATDAVRGPDREIDFDHITVSDGLPGTRYRVLCRITYEHLWIGTQDGLNVYHGYIRMETDNGLNRYDRATESFAHYQHDPGDAGGNRLDPATEQIMRFRH